MAITQVYPEEYMHAVGRSGSISSSAGSLSIKTKFNPETDVVNLTLMLKDGYASPQNNGPALIFPVIENVWANGKIGFKYELGVTANRTVPFYAYGTAPTTNEQMKFTEIGINVTKAFDGTDDMIDVQVLNLNGFGTSIIHVDMSLMVFPSYLPS